MIVEEILKWKIREREKHIREPDVYYVTDLVYCPLQREYAIKFPEFDIYEINARAIFGDIIHMGIGALLKQIYGDRVVTELDDAEALEREQVVDIDGKRVRVRGRIDGIIDDVVGVEVKSTVSTGPLPFEHHIVQAKLYNWLYPLQKTIILYITPDGLYEYEVLEKMSTPEVIQRIRDMRGPRYHWECKYCIFSKICPTYRGNRVAGNER